MKICMLMGGNEEGGLENHVVDISNALAENHEIHIIAHAKYNDRFKGVVFHPLDMTKSRRNPFLLYAVASLLREILPDIAHAQANKAAAIIATLKPYLPGRVKTVATLHSQKRKLEAYERFDWVIGVSSRVLERLKTPNKSVVYNGVQIDNQRIKEKSYLLKAFFLPDGAKLVVSMGRLVTVKRFDRLIKAFKGIENAHLLIAGEGEERQKLEQIIKDSGQKNIHLIGNRNDNIELLSAADLCVISSEREGFSYVMAESLLLGTPVISTDVADMKIILPAQAVIETEKGLHSAMVSALANLDKFNRLFQNSFTWAQQNLSINQMRDQTIQVYRDVLG